MGTSKIFSRLSHIRTCYSILNNLMSRPFFNNSGLSVTLISWNVLAQSYASSHAVDPAYLSRKHRVPLLKAQLRKLMMDGDRNNCRPILALQELEDCDDGLDFTTNLTSVFEECGYELLYAQRGNSGRLGLVPIDSKSNRNLRVDGVCVAYPKANFTHLKVEVVDFDHLVTRLPPTQAKPKPNTVDTFLTTNLAKQNVGVITLLQHRETMSTFVVATCHLFWDPAREFVKLMQMKHFTNCVAEFRSSLFLDPNPPIFLLGDFNSLPKSSVIEFLTNKVVDARKLSPWNNNAGRYICDVNLNKICRSMRILGLDCAIETKEEGQVRSNFVGGRNTIPIIARCEEENRILLSPSAKLLGRVPFGVFVDARELETALPR